MNNKSLHKEFLDTLKGMATRRADLAEEISYILNLDKMNIYRRLRGDVKFSFNEVGVLAKHFGISLNNILKNFPEGPYRSIKMEFPIKPDFPSDMEDHVFPWSIPIFAKDVGKPDSETGMALNVLPRQLYMNFRYLTRYLYLRWMFLSAPEENKRLSQIELSGELWNNCQHIAELCREIKSTFMIWDECIIPDIVNDINYHHSIDLISDGEKSALQKELSAMIDMLEMWTTEGKFADTDNNFELYLSSITVDTTNSYFYATNATSYAIIAFYLKGLINTSPEVCRQMKEQINNQKANALLISKSGAVERKEFFNRQREAVSRLNNTMATNT